MQKSILSFGEALWDLYPAGPVLGGAPLNLALRLHSLGDRAFLVTRLGRDEYGAKAREQFAGWGLDTSHVQQDDFFPTGTAQVTVDTHGAPAFAIQADAAYDSIDINFELLELTVNADCFCFGTLAQRTLASRQSLTRLLDTRGEKLKFLDLNLRKSCFTRDIVAESLPRADILKLNLEEAHYLAGMFHIPLPSLPEFCASVTAKWPVKVCLLTLGADGALAVAADGTKVHVPGYVVNVGDSCGAGDAFSAGFLHAYLHGQALADCCRMGNALGAFVSTLRGATAPASMADVEQFLSAKHRRLPEPTLRALAVE